MGKGIRCMQRIRSADQGVVGQRLPEDGQPAAVQGHPGDGSDQDDRLVGHDEDDRGGGDVIGGIRGSRNAWARKFLCERQRVRLEKVLGALAGACAVRGWLRQDRRRSGSEGQHVKRTMFFNRAERSGVLRIRGHRRWPGRRAGGSPADRRLCSADRWRRHQRSA